MNEIEVLMAEMAGRVGKRHDKRPIFHSEADFQFALAREIQEYNSALKVRLERPFEGESDSKSRIDIFVKNPNGLALAIELKYLTKEFEVEIEGEQFSLRNHSARNIRRYDFVKDIERLETVVRKRQACAGWAIALTNDEGYWNKPRKANTTDADFRLDTDREYLPSGKLSWSKDAGEGTKRGREDDIHLNHKYHICWNDYSSKYGRFRFLGIQVGGLDHILRS